MIVGGILGHWEKQEEGSGHERRSAQSGSSAYKQLRPMILVSGATGTNGKEIVLQLAALGANVRALVRDMNSALTFRGKCVHMAVADFNESLPEAFKSVERALLLASSSPKQVEQERNFIDAAKRAACGEVFGSHRAEPGIPRAAHPLAR